VLCTAIGAVVFMLQVVVPLFEDVFTRFGKDLPGLTKAVISASDVLGAYLPIMLMALVSIFLSYPLFRKKEWFSKLFAWVQQKVPLFGAIIVKMHLLRLVSSLELMLSSNTNLVKAIELSGKMSSFYPIKQSLSEAQKDITNGLQLSESLAKFKIYDSRFLTLIRVGEEVNQLPVTLSKLRIQYEKDIDVFSKTVGSLLEPAIILFIGAFVGTIIIAMYLPMFELSTLF
jgi:type IV pilus assembly protein PilC